MFHNTTSSGLFSENIILPPIQGTTNLYVESEQSLSLAFDLMIERAKRTQPELPTIVFSGYSGVGKTTTAKALSRYLNSRKVEHQIIPTDIFVTRNALKILEFGALLTAANFMQAITHEKIACSVGIKSLKVLHEFQDISDMIRALAAMDLPHSIKPAIKKYRHKELLPKRLTIIEGSCASIMTASLIKAQRCFIAEEPLICRQRYLTREAGRKGKHKLHSKITSLLLHSPAAIGTISSQQPSSDFAMQIDQQFSLKSAFLKNR